MVTTITLSPTSGSPSTAITVTGAGFTGGGAATITVAYIDKAANSLTALLGTVVANAGTWSGTFGVLSNVLSLGAHTVTVTDSGGKTASATLTVVPVTSVTQIWVGEGAGGGADGGTYWHATPNFGILNLGSQDYIENEQGNFTGTSTASTLVTMTDATQTWPANWFNGAALTFTSGPAKGQSQIITGTAAHVLTVGIAFNPIPTPGGGDTYRIDNGESFPLVNPNAPPQFVFGKEGTVVYSEDGQPLWTIWT